MKYGHMIPRRPFNQCNLPFTDDLQYRCLRPAPKEEPVCMQGFIFMTD